MNGLLQQLGGLVLGSVPTILLFLVTLACYRVLVHTPLTKVLKERYARTQGAVEKAASAIAEAEKKTAEYEERLRSARAAIFHVRHGRLHQVHIEAEHAIEEARVAAAERTAAAQIRIEENVETARLQLDPLIDDLAGQVLRTILPAQNFQTQEPA